MKFNDLKLFHKLQVNNLVYLVPVCLFGGYIIAGDLNEYFTYRKALVAQNYISHLIPSNVCE